MQYFNTLPKIIQSDSQGISRIFTNLLVRASVLPSLLKNPLVYYQYDIQDGDTPDIVANKYYGDSYRYWIILFCNQFLDPQWDWPLSPRLLDEYIVNKYPNIQPLSTVHHYEKILTQKDDGSGTETINRVNIDEETYNLLIESTYTTTLPTGLVTVTVTKRAVTYYEYETELNDAKRTINILNSNYVNQVESEFFELMQK